MKWKKEMEGEQRSKGKYYYGGNNETVNWYVSNVVER